MNAKDTIIAPATPVGNGGISIIRLSGKQSLAKLDQFFKPKRNLNGFESHRLYYGNIVNRDDETIDEVMAVFMAAPHSYTAEDVVEIHCHGSRHIVKVIIDMFVKAGLRLADPGEFTYRAYLNGRIDLSQAEAISQLILSSTESSRKMSLAQVNGALSKKIFSFSNLIKRHLVFLEAWIDFPEEDLPNEDLLHINQELMDIRDQISDLINTYHVGRVLNEGVNIVLVGKPNVGKSSLLNALLKEDRAIVTDIPGTTRDILEDGIVIKDIPVRLFDTAGLRASSDPVEQEGICRAEKKIESADLVLILIDSSRELDHEDKYILEKCKNIPHFVVFTKSDLKSVVGSDMVENGFEISVKSQYGLEQLEENIYQFFVGQQNINQDSVMLSERRHYNSLIKCSEYINNSIKCLQSLSSLEFIAFELREALFCLGLITGHTTTEDLLDDIFSGFCIGK